MEFQEIDTITDGQMQPTDITPVGKVNINAYQAVELIDEYRLNIKNQVTDYVGSSNEKNWSIFARELCFSVKDSVCNSRMRWNRPHVLSNLMGFPKTPIEKMYELIKFEGFSVGSGANYDERNINPNPDLALSVGGLTTINNNSDSPISNGDWIMWAIPTSGQVEKNQNVRQSERFLLRTEVFNPEKHEMSINSLIAWMKEKGTTELNDILTKQIEDIEDHHELFYYTLKKGPDPDLLLNDDNEEQLEIFNSLFKAIELHNQKVHSRIIGQAKGKAFPGGFFDLLCGGYRS